MNKIYNIILYYKDKPCVLIESYRSELNKYSQRFLDWIDSGKIESFEVNVNGEWIE